MQARFAAKTCQRCGPVLIIRIVEERGTEVVEVGSKFLGEDVLRQRLDTDVAICADAIDAIDAIEIGSGGLLGLGE